MQVQTRESIESLKLESKKTSILTPTGLTRTEVEKIFNARNQPEDLLVKKSNPNM